MSLEVGRLTLRAPGLAAADGRRLAALVGDRLAAAELPGGGGTLDSIRLALHARAGEPLDALAERIVAQLTRELARSL